MDINLAEELLLLAYDDAGSMKADGSAVDLVLAGALLMELTLAQRVDIVDKHVVVTDPTPTGDPFVDDALAAIGADGRHRKPKDWVSRLSKGLRGRLLDRMVAANVLRRDRDKVLWVFPRTRYPSTTGAEPDVEIRTRGRLRAAVDGGPADPRTGALCALVKAAGLEGNAFPGRPRKEVRARLREVAAASWPADAVRTAIEEVEAAVLAAAMAATIVSTTAAS